MKIMLSSSQEMFTEISFLISSLGLCLEVVTVKAFEHFLVHVQ